MNNDYLVGSCKWTCEAYKRMGIPSERIFLNYYGGTAPEVDTENTKLRDEYGIQMDTPLIGMVSFFYAPKYYLLQFNGIKGHEDFIEAICLVREKIPNAKAVIIGSAWCKAQKYETKIKKIAELKCPGGIVFTGFRNDVLNIYHEIDVVVHPSHSENLGGAGESLLMAVPTISTNVGGFPDIVINGVTGWAVEKNNPKKLSDRIIWMLEHQTEAKEMAKKGKQLCTEILSIQYTAKHMAEIYDKIFNSN